jgi:hypothetical protein
VLVGVLAALGTERDVAATDAMEILAGQAERSLATVTPMHGTPPFPRSCGHGGNASGEE